jgi:hypothetical protein
MVAGEEGYMVSAFGVQIEFSQWMSDLPRLRVAVLTFNVQYPSEVALEEPEALARAIVLGGFQLVVCFGNCVLSVVTAANEVLVNIARCGVLPIVMQEVDNQVVFRMQYPSASSAVAGSKPSSDSSAVAGTDVAPGLSYTDIEADLLTEFQRNASCGARGMGHCSSWGIRRSQPLCERSLGERPWLL